MKTQFQLHLEKHVISDRSKPVLLEVYSTHVPLSRGIATRIGKSEAFHFVTFAQHVHAPKRVSMLLLPSFLSFSQFSLPQHTDDKVTS